MYLLQGQHSRAKAISQCDFRTHGYYGSEFDIPVHFQKSLPMTRTITTHSLSNVVLFIQLRRTEMHTTDNAATRPSRIHNVLGAMTYPKRCRLRIPPRGYAHIHGVLTMSVAVTAPNNGGILVSRLVVLPPCHSHSVAARCEQGGGV